MYAILFTLSLFLIVLIALEMEAFLAPSALVLLFAAVSLLFGVLIIAAGFFRKRPAVGGAIPDGGTIRPAVAGRRPIACLPVVVGGMYGFIGAGLWVLQSIGRHYWK